jgi:hypothetical protein
MTTEIRLTNEQLQLAIKEASALAVGRVDGRIDKGTTNSNATARKLAADHLKQLYAIQFKRAALVK